MVTDNFVRTGKAIYIVDGDTLDMEVDLGFHVSTKIRIRVRGIDAPEVHGITRAKGLVSKAFLTDQLLNKDILIVSTGQDSFRRWLADVYYQDAGNVQKNLADELFASGLAIYKEF